MELARGIRDPGARAIRGSASPAGYCRLAVATAGAKMYANPNGAALCTSRGTIPVGTPVGEPLQTTVRALAYRRLLSARELFGCTTNACEDDRFYTTAWALFSYLTNEHPTETTASG